MKINIHGSSSQGQSTIKGARVLIVLSLLLAHAVLASSDGRVARGKILATDRGKGNCLACHHIAKVLAKVEAGDKKSEAV